MNKAYKKLLRYLLPPWDNKEIDVGLRLASVLGMQGSGKTTLAMTIANDLYQKFGDRFACLYGYWLHKLVPKAIENNVIKGKKYILIVLDDATALLHTGQSRKLLLEDYEVFWRLRHFVKEGGAETHTARVALLINMHSYMTITKYLRNTHVLIVKSIMPKWQRYEHEDITLKWLSSIIAKNLTEMLYGTDPRDETAALGKAVTAYLTGKVDLIKYSAKKTWPPGTFIDTDTGKQKPVLPEKTNGEKPRAPITQTQFIELVRSLEIHARTQKIHKLYRVLFKDILGYEIHETHIDTDTFDKNSAQQTQIHYSTYSVFPVPHSHLNT